MLIKDFNNFCLNLITKITVFYFTFKIDKGKSIMYNKGEPFT